MNGDDMKMATLMREAKSGNAAAIKAVQKIMMGAADVEDGYELKDKMDDVDAEFDLDKTHKETAESQAFDEVFSEVKEDVDFDKNMGIVENDLQSKLPDAIYDAYWNSPHSRKVMYDLVASGRMEPLLEAFNNEISKLPFEKRLDLQRDPQAYGDAFVLVIEQENNKAGKPAVTQTAKSGMASVSNGNSGHMPNKAGEDKPDWGSMSREEFLKQREKLGLNF